MTVELVTWTPHLGEVITAACEICYKENLSDSCDYNLINRVIERGHESVLEHVSFTFLITEVSRALTHQLVRHRLASYSQASQRYIDESNFSVVVPKSISDNEKANEMFTSVMQDLKNAYASLRTLGIPPEDARFVLPNACESRLLMTMNLRELRHFLKLRLCNRAQWEIRKMAQEILTLGLEKFPALFHRVYPPCGYGDCPEGKNSCRKENDEISNV